MEEGFYKLIYNIRTILFAIKISGLFENICTQFLHALEKELPFVDEQTTWKSMNLNKDIALKKCFVSFKNN